MATKAEKQTEGITWDAYLLRMRFEGRIIGSVPMEEDVVSKWLESRAPEKAPEGARALPDIESEVKGSIYWAKDAEEIEEETSSTREDTADMKRVSSGFQMDKQGRLVVRAGTIKAHLKDCARQLYQAKQVKVPVFRSKLANFIYVKPYWVPIIKDGEPTNRPDGWQERPIHVITPMGPRSALKRSMYIEEAELWSIVGILRNPHVTKEHLDMVLLYGGVHGYGAERSLGEGQYDYELIELGPVTQLPDNVLELAEEHMQVF